MYLSNYRIIALKFCDSKKKTMAMGVRSGKTDRRYLSISIDTWVYAFVTEFMEHFSLLK